MNASNLYFGLGSVLYALTKIDGRLQLEEMQTVKELLAQEPNGDAALYAFLVWAENDESMLEAYNFGMRCLTNQPQSLDETTKKHFVNIMIRVANAHDDISRKEREFIQRFRREIRRL
ncbi:hypothetical protein GCM10023187_10420 [Nibrella viscosa]|uniref:Co-chaperone DjlA N-terminal domain-containing protein n=1 Tax=Nibrella viscosa TaxID=1084524 RepID=A0ABP8K220_9BACT